MIKISSTIPKLLFCIAILFLISCSSNSDNSSPPNEYSRSFMPMSAENIANIEEINLWKVMDEGTPISLIQYDLSLNRITAISEQPDMTIVLAVEAGETIFQNVINVPNFRAFTFDEKGEKLLGAMSGQMLDEQGLLLDYLQWTGIWDTRSGVLEYCVSGSCKADYNDDPVTADIGATMDPKAENIVEYGFYGFTIDNLSENPYSGLASINSMDADYWWHIGAIAIDSQNNRQAIIFQEGRIVLEKILEPSNWPFSGVDDVIKRGDENELQPIQSALFDQRGKWLAIVRGEELSIWNVSGWKKEVVFTDQIGNIRGMSFNPSGELLFVGTADQIRVIGLKEKKAIHEIPTPGITSLNISADNRLLFWGDENGTVHAWGIP